MTYWLIRVLFYFIWREDEIYYFKKIFEIRQAWTKKLKIVNSYQNMLKL